MNKFIATAILASIAMALVAGCSKTEESTPPATNTTSTAPNTQPTTAPTPPVADPAALADFSSPEKINSTVIPAVKTLLSSAPALAGKNLEVMFHDKILHVKGDVDNNDQKKAIDAALKPIIDKAKAAGVNFLNGAIVKG